MFKRMQEKWGVSMRQFWIIFIIFGLTGTTTAFITRYITGWLGFDGSTHWGWKLLLRAGMLVLGYQVILLAYGALLGQWAFFWKYERKLLVKLGILRGRGEQMSREQMNGEGTGSGSIQHSSQTRIAIFASGTGSNAAKIIDHFKDHPLVAVALIVCNKPGAGVLGIAESAGIPWILIEKERFFSGDGYVPVLKQHGIGFIVLAGFLWKIPGSLTDAYCGNMINIHPALLPKYGGKGMYGMKVHQSVIGAGEKESGITIHYVNEHFDEGEPIFQASCVVDAADTPETLAQKIHALEHRYFPEVIERLLVK